MTTLTNDDLLTGYWRASLRLRNQDRGFTLTRPDAVEELLFLASGEHDWLRLRKRAIEAREKLLPDARIMPHLDTGDGGIA